MVSLTHIILEAPYSSSTTDNSEYLREFTIHTSQHGGFYGWVEEELYTGGITAGFSTNPEEREYPELNLPLSHFYSITATMVWHIKEFVKGKEVSYIELIGATDDPAGTKDLQRAHIYGRMLKKYFGVHPNVDRIFTGGQVSRVEFHPPLQF